MKEIDIIAEVPCPNVDNKCVGLNFCCDCGNFKGFADGNKVMCSYEE